VEAVRRYPELAPTPELAVLAELLRVGRTRYLLPEDKVVFQVDEATLPAATVEVYYKATFWYKPRTEFALLLVFPPSVTYNDNSIYEVWVDGERRYDPSTSVPRPLTDLTSFVRLVPVFKELKVKIENHDTVKHTYQVRVFGGLRDREAARKDFPEVGRW